MLEKGFLSEKSRRKTAKNRSASPVGKLMVFVGPVIVIVWLRYIVVNLQSADGLAMAWLPSVLVGVAMRCVGVVLLHFFQR